jgi:prepilin-type N-terminal cleavage/methylation domain-containing protein
MTNRNGFTVLELMLVLMIGGIIAGFAARGYAAVANERAAANARAALVRTAFHAQTEARRTGRMVYLNIRPDSGWAWVETSTGQVLHSVDASEYGATMVGAPLRLCYTARGYALPSCTNFSSPATIGYVRAADTSSVVVTALGQVRSK